MSPLPSFLVFCRLASMRRTAGAGPIESVTWAAGLLWRSRRSRA